MHSVRQKTRMVALAAIALHVGWAVMAQTEKPARERGPVQSRGTAVVRSDVSSSTGVAKAGASATPQVATSPSRSNSNTGSIRFNPGDSASGMTSPTRFINENASFRDYGMLVRSTRFFDLLQASYGYAFSPYYFSRYYLNNEPILNRRTLHYSLTDAVACSKELSKAAGEFESLLGEYEQQGGLSAAVHDPRWVPLMKRIRDLAQDLRKDNFLKNIDIHKNSKESRVQAGLEDFDDLTLAEKVNRMGSLIDQVQDQVNHMWRDPSPAVVSVDALAQPSPGALAKGIEDLAKKLEKASRI